MARRRFTTFSLSFLDVMACGFGAVVLVFLIINHSQQVYSEEVNRDLLAEVNLLEDDIVIGEELLVQIRNQINALEIAVAETQGESRMVIDETQIKLIELAELDKDTLAREEHINKLKSDIDRLDDERMKAEREAEEEVGKASRMYYGEGKRQYLTGLQVGGKRILILLDTSASMLDDTIVNVIRRRNMSDDRKLAAPKWTRIVNTLDWITTQIPIASRFQIYGFDSEVRPVIADTRGEWLEVVGGRRLDEAMEHIREIIPSGGTSLELALASIKELDPLPDNVILVTDSLPTQGIRPPRRPTVTGRERLNLFNRAINEVPSGVPVNVILFPLEGDAMAPAAYWMLAKNSDGSFMSPAKDWP
ncbi:MAG: hypothetical protein V3U43_10170 [Pseudomonadales bacterium]